MPSNHLTTDDRYSITHLKLVGYKPAEIARRLGRHRATIARELKRNPDRLCGYHDSSAQRQA